MKPLQGKSVSIENTEDRPTKDNQRISKTPKAVFEDIVWHSVAAHDIIWYSDPAKLLRSCELLVWSFCTSLACSACSACGACGCRGCRSSNCKDTSSTWERRTSVWRRSSFALRTTRSNQVQPGPMPLAKPPASGLLLHPDFACLASLHEKQRITILKFF